MSNTAYIKPTQQDRLEAAWGMLLSRSYTWSHIQRSTRVARSTIARMAKIINLLSDPSGRPMEQLRSSHWDDVNEVCMARHHVWIATYQRVT